MIHHILIVFTNRFKSFNFSGWIIFYLSTLQTKSDNHLSELFKQCLKHQAVYLQVHTNNRFRIISKNITLEHSNVHTLTQRMNLKKSTIKTPIYVQLCIKAMLTKIPMIFYLCSDYFISQNFSVIYLMFYIRVISLNSKLLQVSIVICY